MRNKLMVLVVIAFSCQAENEKREDTAPQPAMPSTDTVWVMSYRANASSHTTEKIESGSAIAYLEDYLEVYKKHYRPYMGVENALIYQVAGTDTLHKLEAYYYEDTVTLGSFMIPDSGKFVWYKFDYK